jgi:hypothetical protein
MRVQRKSDSVLPMCVVKKPRMESEGSIRDQRLRRVRHLEWALCWEMQVVVA